MRDEIQAAIAATNDSRAAAFRALRDDLVVPWKWTEAGVAAAPALAEPARRAGHPARASALILLTDLLAGDHVVQSMRGVDMSEPAQRARYVGAARSILQTASSVADDAIAGLDDPDPAVRSSSGFLLAFLSDVADRSFDAVGRAAERETDPWAKASLTQSLALIGRDSGADRVGGADARLALRARSPPVVLRRRRLADRR